MRYRYRNIINVNLFISLMVFNGCLTGIAAKHYPYHWEVSVDNGIELESSEVEDKFLKIIKQNKKNEILSEIIIYSYTTGKETFFYQGETGGEITKKVDKGRIEALLKIIDKEKCIKVLFVNTTGDKKDELLENLAKELKKILN